MTTAERHAQTLEELERTLKGEDKYEVLARARQTSQETLDAEYWEQWKDAGLSALQDIEQAIGDFVLQGKGSFTDLANHVVGEFYRMALRQTMGSLMNPDMWMGLLKAGLSLAGMGFGGATSGTLPTTWGQYNTMSALGAFSGRQGGGPVSAGHPYMVGEGGPELFIPRQIGTVIPHAQSMQMATPTVVVNVHGVTDASSFVAARGAIQRTVAQAVQASYQAM